MTWVLVIYLFMFLVIQWQVLNLCVCKKSIFSVLWGIRLIYYINLLYNIIYISLISIIMQDIKGIPLHCFASGLPTYSILKTKLQNYSNSENIDSI